MGQRQYPGNKLLWDDDLRVSFNGAYEYATLVFFKGNQLPFIKLVKHVAAELIFGLFADEFVNGDGRRTWSVRFAGGDQDLVVIFPRVILLR